LVFNSVEESYPNSPRLYFSFAAPFCPGMQFSATPSSSENHNA
jgi:hypothetical protein